MRELRLISFSAYGAVYKAQDKRTGLIHAVKIVNVEGDVSSVQKEIKILSECQSPFIVAYIGSYLYEDNLWVCLLSIVQLFLTLSSSTGV